MLKLVKKPPIGLVSLYPSGKARIAARASYGTDGMKRVCRLSLLCAVLIACVIWVALLAYADLEHMANARPSWAPACSNLCFR